MKKVENNWYIEPIYKGQKYLCKKSFPKTHTKTLFLEEGKFYEVEVSENLKVIVKIAVGGFILSPTPLSSVTPNLFWDYFYTRKEERKFKLKKLDENGTLH